MKNLYSGLCEVGLHGDLLSGVDVWVVGLSEGFLELFELSAGERRSNAPLFALLWTDGRRIDVIRRLVMIHLVRQPHSRCDP